MFFYFLLMRSWSKTFKTHNLLIFFNVSQFMHWALKLCQKGKLAHLHHRRQHIPLYYFCFYCNAFINPRKSKIYSFFQFID